MALTRPTTRITEDYLGMRGVLGATTRVIYTYNIDCLHTVAWSARVLFDFDIGGSVLAVGML